MKFDEFPLSKVGHSVQLIGGIWAGHGDAYLCYFPEGPGKGPLNGTVGVEMDSDDWQALLRQSDLMETEVLEQHEDGKVYKAIARKCQRHIDQHVSWRVFKRDGYACRYCGRDDIPLTVDHLVPWEVGGPATEINLISACRDCNKARGNTEYGDWLSHHYYRRVSKSLTPEQKQANADIEKTLSTIPLDVRKKSKR